MKMKNDPDLFEGHTMAGRLWAVACMAVAFLAFLAYMNEMLPSFPPGSYPLIMFAIPACVASLGLYAVGFWIMSRCGIKMRCPPDEDGARSCEPERRQNQTEANCKVAPDEKD